MNFSCPRCAMLVAGDNPATLRCPRCGYPGAQTAPTWTTTPSTPAVPSFTFQPLRSLVPAGIALAIAMVVAQVLYLLAFQWFFVSFLSAAMNNPSRPPTLAVFSFLPWMMLSMLIFFGVQLAQAIVVGTLLQRAARNVRALGTAGHSWSPGWAIGAWYIPYANLVIPFLVVREIWKASMPSATATGWMANRLPGWVGWWWGLWIAGPFVAQMSFFMLAFNARATPSIGAVQYVFVALGTACTAVACYWFIQVLRTIDALQNERARERGMATKTWT